MRHDPALLGLVIAKKKPPEEGPPPFGDEKSMAHAKPGMPGAAKPKIDIKIGDKPDDEAAEGEQKDGSSAHSDLDEIMGGDPKVASAVANLLRALCSEEKAEGDYGSGHDMTGTEGM